MAYDFIVAGGGIGGTVLAHLLGATGKRVLVLEKDLDRPESIRPEVLWPATVERLGTLGAGAELETALMSLEGVDFVRDGRSLGGITPELLGSIRVRPTSSDPNRTREILLRPGPFQVRRGVEVTGVLRRADRVAGVRTRDVQTGEEREELADWTVGDDGARSPIREGAGIELASRAIPLDLLCFGFAWPCGLKPATARFWLNSRQARSGLIGFGAIPIPGGRGAALAPVRPAIFDDLARAREDWKAFAAQDDHIPEILADRPFPDGLVRIRPVWGHAARYGIPGAVLLGDAAHPVSPAGGQGANMAIADAFALAESVAGGEADFIAHYERRRRPANERSISITRRAARGMALPAFLLDWLIPVLIPQLLNRPERIGRAIAFASTAFLD